MSLNTLADLLVEEEGEGDDNQLDFNGDSTGVNGDVPVCVFVSIALGD